MRDKCACRSMMLAKERKCMHFQRSNCLKKFVFSLIRVYPKCYKVYTFYNIPSSCVVSTSSWRKLTLQELQACIEAIWVILELVNASDVYEDNIQWRPSLRPTLQSLFFFISSTLSASTWRPVCPWQRRRMIPPEYTEVRRSM